MTTPEPDSAPTPDPAPAACTVCPAVAIPGHPGGLLVMSHDAACPIGRAEDATQAADYARGDNIRPATDAERTLLAAAGYDLDAADAAARADTGDPAATLRTVVHYLTPSVRRRTWPGIAIPAISEGSEGDEG